MKEKSRGGNVIILSLGIGFMLCSSIYFWYLDLTTTLTSFDMISGGYSANAYPSTNLKIVWHSQYMQFTWNTAGVADPAIDSLLEDIADRQEDSEALLHYGRALDRVLQWNFFLTDVISVFGEPGIAISNYSWESDFCDGPGCEGSDTDFEPFVFWAGARFLLGDTVGIVVRLGTPYISVGVSFLL